MAIGDAAAFLTGHRRHYRDSGYSHDRLSPVLRHLNKHSIAYLATNIKVNDVSPVFWQMVKQQTIMAKLLPVNVLSFISMILLIVQLSSLLVAAVMTLWKEQVKPITKMYLIFSLCVCFLRITYTTEYFQILFYTLCIFANIGVATQCWERKKQEVRTC